MQSREGRKDLFEGHVVETGLTEATGFNPA
jgi:hypothetical protein